MSVGSMKAILVDDEVLALRYLEKKLNQIGNIEITGKYMDVEEALEAAYANPPDVIFLDIGLPGMSGIEAAELLSEKVPGTDVVFVTAYEEYALKAFELNAIDYILKPVENGRLLRTVSRLTDRRERRPAELIERPMMLRCFQLIEFQLNAKSEPIPWRTIKAQELFAYLIHYRNQNVRKDVLLELLWPEIDRKKGTTQLYTAIYQVRKTLGAFGAGIRIISSGNGYRLDLNGVELDVDTWERGVMETTGIGPDTIDRHYALLNLYRGDYFEEYDYLWAESERERLKTIWLRHAMAVAEWLNHAQKTSEAITLYYQVLNRFPYSEEAHFALMQQYAKLKDWASVEKRFTDLEKLMSMEFGTEIQAPIQEWYRKTRLGKKMV